MVLITSDNMTKYINYAERFTKQSWVQYKAYDDAVMD